MNIKGKGIQQSIRKGIQHRIQQGIQQGVQKRLKKEIEVAFSMLRENIDITLISKATGLPEKEIEKLKKGIE